MLEALTTNTFTYEKLSKEEMAQRGILGRLVGIIADTVNPTRNGRKYSEALWDNVFNDPIMKERIENNCCFGELGHPVDREETDMEKIAIVMDGLPKKDSKGRLQAIFNIIDTPNGRILKALCDYGCNIGISSRGSGDLDVDFDGQESVNPDTYNCEGWDAVIIPAVKEARLQYVTESLDRTRYNKTLRQKLQESVDKETEDHKKAMLESLNTLGISLTEEKEIFTICKLDDNTYALATGKPPVINANKTATATSYEEAKEIFMANGYDESELVFESLNEDTPADIWAANEPIEDDRDPQKLDALELQKLTKDELIEVLKDAPVGSTIDHIYENFWTKQALAKGKEPRQSIVEKHKGFKRNYFAPVASGSHQTYWTVGGSETHEYDLSAIIRGKNKYYSVSDGKNFSITEDLEEDEIKITRDSKDTDYHRMATAYEHSISFSDKEKESGRIADIIDYLENNVQPFDIYDNKTDNGCTIFYDGDLGIVESWGDLSGILNEANVADDDDMAIVNELQEALKLNKKLDEKIVSLQEKLSACYAKEMKLEETIDSYKIKAAELSNRNKENLALHKKISKLEEDLKTSTEEAASKKTTLHETMQRDAKERKTLQESISNKDNEIARLTEELEGVLKDVKVRDKMLDENNEKLETLSKDNRQLKEKYSKKLEQNNKLIEKYKRIAKTAVDKYIDRQATILGVSNQEIKNRLPESYTFTDIDTICEGLREYKVNMNSLPFNTTLNENISLTAKNISNKTLIHDTDDEITDADIKLAERFIK